MEPQSQRLDRYLASATGLSRKQARVSIRLGTVTLDGQVQTETAARVNSFSQVTLDGTPIKTPEARYLMLNKPNGVICATRDAHQTTVIDLLNIDNADQLQIAGRLDKDTTGLVLLTDDGQWNHRVTSPRAACNKIYQVTTAEPIAPSAVELFARGILLRGEQKPTLPAHLILLGSHSARLSLSEGRYHQVKRMFAAIENRVTALHRIAIGHIDLDQSLPAGGYRPLTGNEISSASA